MHMKEDAMNNGQTKPGYNVQIATENQYIVNYGLYWRPTDCGTMIPFLKSFFDRYGFKRFLLKSTRKVSEEWGLVSLAHNLRKYVAQKTKERDRYAQSMAGRGLVSGSLTTTSEGWMKRSGTLEEPSDCDFAIL